MGDVLIGEFEKLTKREHRIWLVKRKGAKPKPILQAERANTQGVKTLCVCSFSVGYSLELWDFPNCFAIYLAVMSLLRKRYGMIAIKL